MLQTRHASEWTEQLKKYASRFEQARQIVAHGRLRRSVGMTLEAEGCQLPVGRRCRIVNPGFEVEAEVVGFDGERTFLIPLGECQGTTPGAEVIPILHEQRVGVGPALLGRVIDGLGRPLDGGGPIDYAARVSEDAAIDNPMNRIAVTEPLDVGIRSINSLATIGQGQRIGLFAGSGVGKSVLLGMMTRFTHADVIVVGLIGERGREVQEFIHTTLGPEAMQRAVVVASPADTSPVHRVHAAERATAIARHFRDQGQRVLLLMDSLTRYAQAHREIALAVGEPPATKGYTASVFAKLSELVERAGNATTGGTLTSIYTVLVEGDDHNDPVADSARSFLDGHIVLSRSLAESGVYPAVDVEASISRVMPALITAEHRELASQFVRLHSAYEQNRDLITVGAYSGGSDPLVDQAIASRPQMLRFLSQDMHQQVLLGDALKDMQAVLGAAEPPA